MKAMVFPLNNSRELFDTVDTRMAIIKQNIICLLLTDKNERVIRRSKIGIPFNNIFFENDRESALELLKTNLDEAIKSYFNDIRVDYVKEIDANVTKDTPNFDVEIQFTDTQLNISEKLIIRG